VVDSVDKSNLLTQKGKEEAKQHWMLPTMKSRHENTKVHKQKKMIVLLYSQLYIEN
jgi:hypothetical protein